LAAARSRWSSRSAFRACARPSPPHTPSPNRISPKSGRATPRPAREKVRRPLTNPHRRFNPRTQEWVLVSPQRLQRPWKGEVAAQASLPPAHDPACYLCPGDPRSAGRTTPNFNGVYIFENDFPTVRDEAPSEAAPTGSPLLRREPERGLCRVLCFSPRHDLSLARLPLASVEAVVAAWVEQSSELMARPEFASVMVFENRGAMMGA